MMLSVCICIIIEALIKDLLNCYKGYQALGFIVTIQIWIVTSIHGHICVLYTGSLTVLQSAVMLRCGESCYEYFKLASPLFIMPSLCNYQLPFMVLISIQKVLSFCIQVSIIHNNYSEFIVKLPSYRQMPLPSQKQH